MLHSHPTPQIVGRVLTKTEAGGNRNYRPSWMIAVADEIEVVASASMATALAGADTAVQVASIAVGAETTEGYSVEGRHSSIDATASATLTAGTSSALAAWTAVVSSTPSFRYY